MTRSPKCATQRPSLSHKLWSCLQTSLSWDQVLAFATKIHDSTVPKELLLQLFHYVNDPKSPATYNIPALDEFGIHNSKKTQWENYKTCYPFHGKLVRENETTDIYGQAAHRIIHRWKMVFFLQDMEMGDWIRNVWHKNQLCLHSWTSNLPISIGDCSFACYMKIKKN